MAPCHTHMHHLRALRSNRSRVVVRMAPGYCLAVRLPTLDGAASTCLSSMCHGWPACAAAAAANHQKRPYNPYPTSIHVHRAQGLCLGRQGMPLQTHPLCTSASKAAAGGLQRHTSPPKPPGGPVQPALLHPPTPTAADHSTQRSTTNGPTHEYTTSHARQPVIYHLSSAAVRSLFCKPAHAVVHPSRHPRRVPVRE
jgi:hypothetical protein